MLSGYGKYAVTAGYDGQRGFRNTANFVNSAMPSGTQGRHIGKPTELSVLDGIVPSPDDDNMLRLMQRDMYLHDPVVGSIVDLSSQLLFGDFSISGVPDRAIIQKFQSSLENMRIKSYLNGVSLDYFVDGAHLGVMNFDKDERIFDGIIPQDIINADITPIPYYGHSPIVDLKPSETFKKLLKNSSDPRVKRVIEQLPKILQGLSKGIVKLQPEAVLYVPRKASTYMGIGISALRRLIPLFTLEKALIRGTVELVHRRQSGIKHIRVGDDMWVATSEELSGIANLFSAADADPIGAFVATRPSVDIQDVASIGDSWRWTDVIEQATTLKFRALGFSESLLSGEATFSNAEQGMNVFVKQQTSLRDYITRTVFYEKIFPYLSVVNGYEKKEYKESSRIYRENGSFFAEIADSRPLREIDLNIDDYYIPTVTWHSSLRPEGDGNYMELLDALDKKGLPIPMRMMAAALGVSITDILYGMDEDIEIRQKLSEYREAIKEYLPQTEEVAGIAEFGNKRKPLAERDFTELSERMTPNTINGHRYVSTAEGRRQKNEQANKVMAQAAAEFGKKMNKITQNQHTVPLQKQPLESLFGTF